MLERIKIKDAIKSALRLALHIAGFIYVLARNITPHSFLLCLFSFLLVLIFAFFLSFFIPSLLLVSFLFLICLFDFCLLFSFLCFSLSFFPLYLSLLLISFLPRSSLSQFPFFCLTSCFLLLLYWHFSRWPFYVFPLCFSVSPVSVILHSVTLQPSDVPISSLLSTSLSYYSYSSRFKTFGLFCFHGKSSFRVSWGVPTSHWLAGLYFSSSAADSCLTSLQIHSYQSHLRCSVCYEHARHFIILGFEDYKCHPLIKPFRNSICAVPIFCLSFPFSVHTSW
jgi:hypothetical protein